MNKIKRVFKRFKANENRVERVANPFQVFLDINFREADFTVQEGSIIFIGTYKSQPIEVFFSRHVDLATVKRELEFIIEKLD